MSITNNTVTNQMYGIYSNFVSSIVIVIANAYLKFTSHREAICFHAVQNR